MLLSRIILHNWWFLLHVQAAYVSRTEFWRMLAQTGVNAGNWLYIDGGATILASDPAKILILNQTLSIDLSRSWTTSLVVLNDIQKPASCSKIKWPSLWFDSKSNSIYSFGGEPFELGSELSVWALLPDGQGGGTWTEKFSPTNKIFSALTRPAWGLSTFSSTAGYSLGGIATARTSPQTTFLNQSILPLSGMMVFTFDVQSWTNIDTSGYSQSGGGFNGAAHFISSFGKEGILVFIGGNVPPAQQEYDIAGAWQRSMDEITIFDIYNQKWYHQTATGDVPASTTSFCSSRAQESKTGFYEIFVFGGVTGSNFGLSNVDSHQVYILTLPAFRWIRATNSSTASRAGHHCLVIGNRHMLSIGGFDPTADNMTAVVDPWPYGLGLFDMTTLQWTDKYDAAAMPYVQPEQVKTYYSNGPKYPSSWNDSLLEAVFTSSTNQAENHHPKGEIFGSVFGGVGGLAVFIVAVWLWFKKKYNKRSASRPIDEQNGTLLFNDALTYAMIPEMAATTPTGMMPELAARTSARLNDEYPHVIKPEPAVTTPAESRDRSNVEENVNIPQAQVLDPKARRPLEIIELPGSFSR